MLRIRLDVGNAKNYKYRRQAIRISIQIVVQNHKYYVM